MATLYVTQAMKDDILAKKGETILTKIFIEPMLMTQLVAEEVVNADESNDIMDKSGRKEKLWALKEHLQRKPMLAFLSFCVVLYDKHDRYDIIQDFGLDINLIRSDIQQIKKGQQGQSSSQRAQPADIGGVSVYPFWDENNPHGRAMLQDTDLYKTKVKAIYDTFVQRVKLDNLWPRFKLLKVLNNDTTELVKAVTTSSGKVFKLMEILENSHVWRFHAFLKALYDDEQGACIELLGLDPATYKGQPWEQPQQQIVQPQQQRQSQPFIDNMSRPFNSGAVQVGLPQREGTASSGDEGEDIADFGGEAPTDIPSAPETLSITKKRVQATPVSKTKNANLVYHEELQKGLKHMVEHASQAPKVVIAILDTGIYTQHPRLKDYIIDSHNCFPGGDDDLYEDEDNHGTPSAGIVVQFAGHCAEIVNVKVHSEDPGVCMEDVDYMHEGMKWISEWEKDTGKEVDIILTSIGDADYEFKHQGIFDETLGQLGKTKVIIAAASNHGNVGVNTVTFPASHPSVLAIGSRNAHGNTSDFSARGEALNFMFRGEDIYTTSRPPYVGETEIELVEDSDYMGDYMKYCQGTSFAAPHCAAAVANILAYTHSCSGLVYRAALTNTASMKELLIKARRQEHHSSETGYGFPDFTILRSEYIQTATREMYSDQEWELLVRRYGGRDTA